MSAKTIKRSSAWAHKSPSAPIEMHRIARGLDGYIYTPNGRLDAEAYELTRRAHPDLALPPLADLPPRDLAVVLQ